MEYIIVRDEKNKIIGLKEVSSKMLSSNTNAFIINGSLIYSIAEFYDMQNQAKNLTDVKE